MGSSWKYQVLSLVTLSVLGVCQPAHAQTALLNGSSFGYDGLTYTVSNCVFTLNGTADTSGCGAANAQLIETGTTGGASVEVESATAGQPLMSIASTGGNTYDDLTFDLSISAPSTKTTVSSVTDTLAGSGNAADPTQVTSSVSATSTNPSFGLNASLATPTVSGSFSSFNPTVAAPLYLSVDLKVTTMPGAGGNQGAIALNNVAFAVSPAPEPASIALFGTALAGLAAVRRRLKRPNKQGGGQSPDHHHTSEHASDVGPGDPRL